jgi:YVTN family beta-propeller protein
MRIRLVAAVCIVLCLADAATAAERIYVLSQAGAALSAIEGEQEKVAWSVGLDKAPAAFVLSPDGLAAYVSHPDLGQVSVVDLETRSVVRRISVGGSPFGVALSSDGRLFVGDWNGAHVSVVGVERSGSGEVIEVGRAPAHLLLTPDETLLFIANRESDSVSVVRTSDLAVLTTIPVGRAPFAMALSPDEARLYVGNVQSGDVSVIDVDALKVVETLASGAMPYGAAVTPDASHVLVTNQQAGTVSVLSAGGEATESIKVGGYPEGVAVSADGSYAVVANWFSDDVSVLDLASGSELRRIKCPSGPRGIVVSAPRP